MIMDKETAEKFLDIKTKRDRELAFCPDVDVAWADKLGFVLFFKDYKTGEFIFESFVDDPDYFAQRLDEELGNFESDCDRAIYENFYSSSDPFPGEIPLPDNL